MKRIILMLLTAVYIGAPLTWFVIVFAMGPQSFDFWAVRMLVLTVAGYGAWIGKNYLKWRWRFELSGKSGRN